MFPYHNQDLRGGGGFGVASPPQDFSTSASCGGKAAATGGKEGILEGDALQTSRKNAGCVSIHKTGTKAVA